MLRQDCKEDVKYIRESEGPDLWRPNPDDPYFYISFSPEQGDQPPFTDKLTCEDTLMVYDEACPPLLTKLREMFDGAPLEEIPKYNDPDPSVQKKFKELSKYYPGTLGPCDIEAIKEFLKSWEQRNSEAIVKQVEAIYEPQKYHEDLTRVPAYQETLQLGLMDKFYSWLAHSLRDLMIDSPSYFSPHLNLWSGNNRNLTISNNHRSISAFPQVPRLPRVNFFLK